MSEGNGRKSIRVVAAVVQSEGLYLITQRRDEAVLAGLWEFPGGRVEPGESDAVALRRELRERLDVDATISDKLAERHTAYAAYDLTLALYSVTLDPATPPHAKRVKAFRWIASGDFEKYPFPAADQQTMDQLLGFRR
jgi:8-oxo-dGTP diphosphatase